VAPKDEVQAKALSMMRKALAQTKTFGIDEIAFTGREHLAEIDVLTPAGDAERMRCWVANSQ
jgi:non-homologous end joining protein Ku